MFLCSTPYLCGILDQGIFQDSEYQKIYYTILKHSYGNDVKVQNSELILKQNYF